MVPYQWTERKGFFEVIKGFDGEPDEIDVGDTVRLEFGKFLFTVEVRKVIPPRNEGQEAVYQGLVKQIEDWTRACKLAVEPMVRHTVSGYRRGQEVRFLREHVSSSEFLRTIN